MTDIREIAADYLHLAQDADGKVDRVRRKRHAELLQLANMVEAIKKMPRSYRFANPAAFAIVWEKWYYEKSNPLQTMSGRTRK
jgi:hypothetical protein